MGGSVLAVHRSSQHAFSKATVAEIELVEGLGVRGDAHAGTTVQHRSRVRADPDQPNLRQVHLIPREVLDQLVQLGFQVAPGDLGENLTTAGVDLLSLPVGARLRMGEAMVTVTGLRKPCRQIEDFRPGLLKHLVSREEDGTVKRLAGVMGIVSRGGVLRAGADIEVTLPPAPHHPLSRV